MNTVKLTLAELGRVMARKRTATAKHYIKKVDRFLGNNRIEPAIAMEGWIRWFACPRKQLLVPMARVDVRQWYCLVLAVRYKGRALPLLWATYKYEQMFRSQNNYEYAFCSHASITQPDEKSEKITTKPKLGISQLL
jgi:hypothetical protein